MIIAVIGGNVSSRPSATALSQASAVGAEIARRGHILVCGGLGGVMGAACAGAAGMGGTTIGVLPGSDRSGMNRHVQIPIVTGMGDARNVIIALTADAVIAIGGAYGTLSEIAHVLNSGKPVVAMGTWEISRDGAEDSAIYRTEDAVEAVEWALEAAGRIPRPGPLLRGEGSQRL
jgi:hypothetical protein